MSWKGMATSRPEASKPSKPGSINMSKEAPKGGNHKGINETFADRREAGGGSWKGNKDNRPDAAGK